MKFKLTLILFFAMISAGVADSLDTEKARLERNKQTVISFYTTFMNAHDPESAIAKYTGDEYRQHNPFVADGKQAFIDTFHGVFKDNPNAHMEIKRIVAEGDYVVVHVHHLSSKGGKGRASMDWFRLDENGKIVEHWDVMQWVPEDNETANDNTMF